MSKGQNEACLENKRENAIFHGLVIILNRKKQVFFNESKD